MRVLFTGILVFTAWHVFASGKADSLWQLAERSYMNGDFEQAIAAYQAVIENHGNSIPAMYNLGNSYLQSGDIGNAVLWYERVLKRRPNDSETRHNMEVALARRENAMIEIREFFLVRWFRGLSNILTPVGWGIISLILFWAGIGLLGFGIHREQTRTLLAAVCGTLFLLTLGLGILRYQDIRRNDIAIVTQGAVEVKIAPDADSKQVTLITPGEKVYILDSLQGYLKVRLVNFEQGWVPTGSIERI